MKQSSDLDHGTTLEHLKTWIYICDLCYVMLQLNKVSANNAHKDIP